MATRIRFRPARGLARKLAAMPEITRARQAIALEIVEKAKAGMPARAGGRAKATLRVETVRSVAGPPKIYAAYGSRQVFYVIFIEFGGSGFRPPPAPLRTAARRVGNYRDVR